MKLGKDSREVSMILAHIWTATFLILWNQEDYIMATSALVVAILFLWAVFRWHK